ncbi:IreB family regulatory phosphoprotein [Candidatus Syntrophocurvum alkaliphilum]|nr:IreB family regulatory phosphoprotein [Candidatus Syntrophocurvum alkaliphilum]
MPQVPRETVSFKLDKEGEEKVYQLIKTVYEALEEKGYNPINQLVGYMISGDPAYITSHNQARNLIRKVERDEILEILIKNYLK